MRTLRLMVYLVCFSLPIQAAITLKLDTNLAPPYQINRDGELSGLAVDALQCVLQRLQVGYDIEVVPWRRAQRNLRAGLTDGLFSVMPLPEMEPYARLSSPLVLEKWYWFALQVRTLQQAEFPRHLRIGVLRGSNQESWLEAQGWTAAQTVNHLDSLLRLLAIGRVDVILADQQAMERQQRLDASQLARQFERYVPLGVYFSSRLLSQQPQFLSRFNRQLSACHGDGLMLSLAEADQLRQQVDQDAHYWLHEPQLVALLAQGWPVDRQWQERDRIWQYTVARDHPYPQWMLQLLTSPLSQNLALWQQRHRDRYSEVFISSQQGVLLASSVVTTDYWQGDEEKVQATLRQASQGRAGEMPAWIDGQTQRLGGRIDFDDSSNVFIAHLSYPLWYQNRVVAVITFGVKVESLLHSAQVNAPGEQNRITGSIVN